MRLEFYVFEGQPFEGAVTGDKCYTQPKIMTLQLSNTVETEFVITVLTIVNNVGTKILFKSISNNVTASYIFGRV